MRVMNARGTRNAVHDTEVTGESHVDMTRLARETTRNMFVGKHPDREMI